MLMEIFCKGIIALLGLIAGLLILVLVNPRFLIAITIAYHRWNLSSLGFDVRIVPTPRVRRAFRLRASLLLLYLLAVVTIFSLLKRP